MTGLLRSAYPFSLPKIKKQAIFTQSGSFSPLIPGFARRRIESNPTRPEQSEEILYLSLPEPVVFIVRSVVRHANEGDTPEWFCRDLVSQKTDPDITQRPAGIPLETVYPGRIGHSGKGLRHCGRFNRVHGRQKVETPALDRPEHSHMGKRTDERIRHRCQSRKGSPGYPLL